jgi:hypothetical protein
MARNYAATRLPASSDLHQCFLGIATRQHRGNAAAQQHRENSSINLPQMGRQEARFGDAALN